MRLLLFVSIYLMSFSLFAQQWQFTQVGDGIKPNIEISSDGKILIAAMKESTTEGFVNLITIENDSSRSEIVAEGYFYGPLDMALQADNSPIIAYHDHLQNGGDLGVATKDNNEWVTSFVESSGHDGWDGTLAIDAAGNLHVVSTDGGNGIEYGFFNGSTWTIETITDVGAMYQYGTDIELDGDGNVHVTYFIDDKSTLYYAVKSDSIWTIDSLARNAIFPSLALRGDDVYIAYYQTNRSGNTWDQNGEIRLAKKSNGSWSSSLIDNIDLLITGSMTGARAIVDLKKDSNNQMRIAYSNQKVLKYGVEANEIWNIDTIFSVVNQSINLGQQTTMAIDSEGIAHIAIYHRLNSPSNGRIWYAKSPPMTMDTTEQELAIVCPADTVVFCDSNIDPSITGIVMVDSSFTVNFSDSIMGDCVESQIIRRQWIAANETQADTCIQLITIIPYGFDQVTIVDTLMLDLPCDFDINSFQSDSLELACGVLLDSIEVSELSSSCESSMLIRSYFLRQNCTDSAMSIEQIIQINHPDFYSVDTQVIGEDDGENSGSITLDISTCDSTGVSFLWSNDSTGTSINNLSAGEYSLVISNDRGCADSLSFVIEMVDDGFNLQCPPDTTISCNILISPAFTGIPIVDGYNKVSFTDSVISGCPDDILLERTWIAFSDSIDVKADTCVQLITIIVDKFEDFMGVTDTLEFSGFCLTSLNDPILEGLNLPCNVGIDSVNFNFVENTCERKVIEASWTFGDQCRDTSVMVRSIIILNDPKVVDFAQITIQPDTGNNSGLIILDPACMDGELSYNWSNGGQDTSILGLAAGIYSVIITNENGCSDSLSFTIEGVPDSTIYELTCPADVMLICDQSLEDASVMATIMGFDSLSFVDSIIQDCPLDRIIQRTWTATSSAVEPASCIQMITIASLMISNDTLNTIELSNICLNEVADLAMTELNLNCGTTLDSVIVVMDSVTCDQAIFNRTYQLSNTCLDTSYSVTEQIIVKDYLIASVAEVITNSDESNNGSISVSVAECMLSDSLTFLWSTGDNGPLIDSLSPGEYMLTLTSSSGCSDSYSYTVSRLDTTERRLDCALDITLGCGSNSSVEITGEPSIIGYDSLSYSDNIISACPSDEVIERTWFAYIGESKADSCVQRIEIKSADLAAVTVPATLTFSNTCLEDIGDISVSEPTLNCDVVLDTVILRQDTVTCDMATFTRIYQFSSACRDTTFTREQVMQFNNIRISRFTNADITEDGGSGSGSVSVTLTTCTDSLTYLWSNGDQGPKADSLIAGRHSVTVMNSMGCQDNFQFTVPLADTAVLDSMLTIDLVNRLGEALTVDSAFLVLNNNTKQPIEFGQSESTLLVKTGSLLANIKEICLIRNEEAIIDLTVTDIRKAQLLILGIDRSCPEDELAGDVNLSGGVSGADIVLMRNVILEKSTAYPSGLSWRFVNLEFFPINVDASSAECIPISVMNKTTGKVEAMGIKLGDYRCEE